ncbi:MAG TPA: hypothetical protein DCZ55_07615 [Cyanobacteria bacterium UBA11371]|nr:hypothetical protein [Cyanobacteria bacterium UBA11371]
MVFKRIFRSVVLLLGLWLGFDFVSYLVTEILWFQEIGDLPVFLTRIRTQLGLWAIAFGITAAFLLYNLDLAQQLKYPTDMSRGQKEQRGRGTEGQRRENFLLKESGLRLRWLLPIVLGLMLLVALMLLHYGEVVFSFWHPDLKKPLISPPLPPRFDPTAIGELFVPELQIWQLGLVVGIAIAIFWLGQFCLKAIALALSLCFGAIVSAHWDKILPYFHPTAFNRTEPLFNRDISFYVFSLPVWQLLEFWLVGLFLYGLIAVALIYLLSGDSLSQGSFPGFSLVQQRHLNGLGSGFMLTVAFSYWLQRYELLYSTRGVAYGASYTDVTAQLPAYTTLSLVSLAIAAFLLWKTVFWLPTKKAESLKVTPILFITLFFLLTGSYLIPVLVQRLIVQPNELARERPYIQRSIALTRQAFALEDIDVETFDPDNQLNYNTIGANPLTIRNIRLWDTRPLLETNRQLQRIRLYYEFPNADIDRYTLKVEGGTEKRQVILAARELDYSAVPSQAQTWVNEHLVYTHGYGFTMSPVNTVAAGGLPDYFVKNISGPTGTGNGGALQTSSASIRASIPISRPRIYYGEITNTYVMAPTKVQELDYPSGEDNVYNTYDGLGGIQISNWWQRLLFAQYLKDWQMVLTRNFTPETKLLFRRNINERVRAIAPFLRYDNDPYLVVADAEGLGTRRDVITNNYLYWVIDAYTTSDRYPYSDPGKYEFNYIRNSVKVVIDAYNGSIFFFVADANDPLIKTWQTIFPELFQPLSEMPVTLRSHIRYPEDFYSTQSERFLTYHMTDPQVFYNREDQWQIPQEIYGSEQQPVQPYYLIMKLPTAASEEFILLLPFTPTQRNNLIGWLAARSDGENYGRLLLYQFPKQELVFGPEQIEARINQDPVISQQISLWNRRGSRAIQGNLLVIPVERSLLYVEPLYLEAEQNSLPTLVRVIVAYENRIVMAETLEQALQVIFQPQKPPAPAIIRSVESANPSP